MRGIRRPRLAGLQLAGGQAKLQLSTPLRMSDQNVFDNWNNLAYNNMRVSAFSLPRTNQKLLASLSCRAALSSATVANTPPPPPPVVLSGDAPPDRRPPLGDDKEVATPALGDVTVAAPLPAASARGTPPPTSSGLSGA